MNRRHFLTISAAAALTNAAFATPLRAETSTWQGRALGSDVSVTLAGPAPKTTALWRQIAATLARIESHFSLYQDSALTRLNRDAHLAYPAPEILDLIALASRVHSATNGAFDPSVQPLWLATAMGTDPGAAQTGWHRLRANAQGLRLEPGMALTFNGIAQGYAADQVATLLRKAGYDTVLIDMGEISALGPWRAAVASPNGQILAQIPLENRALATSSPRGTIIGANRAHILHTTRQPLWGTVAISAPTAALADALSTACCLMTRPEIDAAIAALPGTQLEAIAPL